MATNSALPVSAASWYIYLRSTTHTSCHAPPLSFLFTARTCTGPACSFPPWMIRLCLPPTRARFSKWRLWGVNEKLELILIRATSVNSIFPGVYSRLNAQTYSRPTSTHMNPRTNARERSCLLIRVFGAPLGPDDAKTRYRCASWCHFRVPSWANTNRKKGNYLKKGSLNIGRRILGGLLRNAIHWTWKAMRVSYSHAKVQAIVTIMCYRPVCVPIC